MEFSHPSTWPIRRLALLGGTHGNERTGVLALQQFRRHPEWLIPYPDFFAQTILANPRATERNSRYIDCDLNRQYTYTYPPTQLWASEKDLADTSNQYEKSRVLDIYRELDAWEKPIPLLMDMHSTTSHMGLCLIIPRETPLIKQLCSVILTEIPNSFVFCEHVSMDDDTTSSSIAENALVFEIGPVAQGESHPIPVQTMQIAVRLVIDQLRELTELYPTGLPSDLPIPSIYQKKIVYRWGEPIDYPRDEHGLPCAMIHPDFIHTDGAPLREGQPIFLDQDGKTITLSENSYFPKDLLIALQNGKAMVPIFIGESAYIEKGIAFQLGEANTSTPLLTRIYR